MILNCLTPNNTKYLTNICFLFTIEHCKKISVEEVIIQLFENEELPAPILLKTILPNLQKFEDVVQCPEGAIMRDPVVCPAFQDLPEYAEKK